MSNNAQILVKEHKGRFYVFSVMAESWGEWDEKHNKLISDKNYLELSRAKQSFPTREEAHQYAHGMIDDDPVGWEYGVVDEVLYKDQEPVEIKEQS